MHWVVVCPFRSVNADPDGNAFANSPLIGIEEGGGCDRRTSRDVAREREVGHQGQCSDLSGPCRDWEGQ